MSVGRFDHRTGDQKQAGEDLLNEIKSTITDQTDTLEKILKENYKLLRGIQKNTDPKQGQKEIVASLSRIEKVLSLGGTVPSIGPNLKKGGSGGDYYLELIHKTTVDINRNITRGFAVAAKAFRHGGGGGPRPKAGSTKDFDFGNFGHSLAGVFGHNSMITSLLGSFGGLTKKSKTVETALTALAAKIYVASHVYRYFNDRMKVYTEFSQTGQAHFWDIMVDDFRRLEPTTLIRNIFTDASDQMGDSLYQTSKLILANAERFSTEMLMAGKDLNQASKEIRGARLGIKGAGFNLDAFMKYGDQNEAILDLASSLRRSGMMDRLDAADAKKAMADQLATMGLVAQNTGLTVKQLVKMTAEQRKNIADLVGSGILSKGEGESYNAALTALAKSPALKGIIEGIANAGGSFEAYLAKNPDLQKALAATGNIDLMRQINELAKNGKQMGLSDEQIQNEIAKLQKQMAENARARGLTGPAAAEALGPFKTLFGEAQAALTYKGKPVVNGLFSWLNQLEDFFTNVVPWDAIKAIAGIASGAVLIANTVATLHNTGALRALTARIGGMFGFGAGGPGKKAGIFRRWAGRIGGIGGALLGIPGLEDVIDEAASKGSKGAGTAGAGTGAGAGAGASAAGGTAASSAFGGLARFAGLGKGLLRGGLPGLALSTAADFALDQLPDSGPWSFLKAFGEGIKSGNVMGGPLGVMNKLLEEKFGVEGAARVRQKMKDMIGISSLPGPLQWLLRQIPGFDAGINPNAPEIAPGSSPSAIGSSVRSSNMLPSVPLGSTPNLTSSPIVQQAGTGPSDWSKLTGIIGSTMSQNTGLLEKIVSVLVEGNEISGGIKDGVSKFGQIGRTRLDQTKSSPLGMVDNLWG